MIFYLLPKEIVARTELTDLPRDPHKSLDDPQWRKIYESAYFQLVLTDTWAWLVWPYLGIRGGMEQYSGDDPFWRLAHAYPLWIQVFRAMGLTAERYRDLKPGAMFRYLPYEDALEIVRRMVDCYKRNSNFEQIREVVHRHRAHEDYDTRNSRVKIDFHRAWYHSRSQVKVVDMVQTEGKGYRSLEKIDSRLDLELFTGRMDGKNQRIIHLLLAGYTQVEIAQRLGFANHSGVNKRIKKIGMQLVEYMQA